MTNDLKIDPITASDSEIGRWLWGLEEVRKRTLRLVSDSDQRLLDWRGADGGENSIGSLLYHIAIVEMSWLYLDLLQQEFPPEVSELFPIPMADEAGKVSHVVGMSLADHIQRLKATREIALSIFQKMDCDEWRRLRPPVNDQPYEATPEWAVFHLIEHEAGHAFQISSLKARWNRFAK
ncbi:DinB family protein [Gimesia fumaroli]|uniref:DinB superfamily protein n=1 Tax=Gimesia fumaroli TaxID=2527976 RepID=A0A518I6W4_9PLAN|nr:DinB family protein [Gimesia fumaroli]QDV48835.1 DinB superfamily protein [Gimesia fumaroli]